jgi:hypothetical protein
VLDSNTPPTELGLLLTHAPETLKVLTATGKIIDLGGNGDISESNLRYTTNDCSGQVYLSATTPNYIVKSRDGNYFESTGTSVITGMNSYWRSSDATCIPYSNANFYLLEATQVADPATELGFSLPVLPPYSLQQ